MINNLSNILSRFHPLQGIVYLAGWLPLGFLLLDYYAGNLTVNPIQAATQRSGQLAVIFLLLSLTCTPLVKLAGLRQAAKLRRPLGLFSFLYAGLHFLLFIWADYGWRIDLIFQEIVEKRYLWVGVPAFIILLVLAITSIRSAMRKLGRRWKPLHRLVYLATILIILHMAWVSKGDLFTLSGDILKPLLAAIAVIILLVLRLPWLVRIASRNRQLRNSKINPPGKATTQTDV